MQQIVVLTGAGISAESGLKTFRDSGGLWEGHSIDEVASIDGWLKNKEKVLDFYNKRREQAFSAIPNPAHIAIQSLESHFDVTVITQNVDDLHEKAGSTNVIHLHGLLREARSENDPDVVIDIGGNPIQVGDLASDGSQLRPNIVWFGEPVPMIEMAAGWVRKADIFIVVGTSLAVYPAAGLIHYTKKGIPKYIIDPNIPELGMADGWNQIRQGAALSMPELAQKLLENVRDDEKSE